MKDTRYKEQKAKSFLVRENCNRNHTKVIWYYIYLIALQYLQIERVVNRVHFAEEMLYE